MNSFNESKLKELAIKYESAKSNENDLEVQEVYNQFIQECLEQFKQIPIQVFFTESDPYIKSKDLFSDIEKGYMKVFTGGEKHPLLTKEENSIFRAVHDYFGHYKTKGNFKPEGEFKAWQAHSRMFTLKANRALLTETLAQVAVYFYGSNPSKYAKQKAVLLI